MKLIKNLFPDYRGFYSSLYKETQFKIAHNQSNKTVIYYYVGAYKTLSGRFNVLHYELKDKTTNEQHQSDIKISQVMVNVDRKTAQKKIDELEKKLRSNPFVSCTINA
jgi:hypothetical protein